jgi:predicted ABC-type ATPase
MLIRINNLIKDEKSFAFETTLSSKGYVNLIQNCRDAGYVVNLIFLYISNPIINIGRVEDRVRNGGHNIEDSVIQRRYYRGIENLISSYLPIVDNAMLFDGSNMQFSLEEDRIMEKVNEKMIIFLLIIFIKKMNSSFLVMIQILKMCSTQRAQLLLFGKSTRFCLPCQRNPISDLRKCT